MKSPFLPLLPLMIVAATLVVSMVAISIRRDHRLVFCLTLAGIIAALVALVAFLPFIPRPAGFLFVFDGFALFYGGLALGAGFLAAVLSYDYLKERSRAPEEFYLLLSGASSGPLPLSPPAISSPFFLASKCLASPCTRSSPTCAPNRLIRKRPLSI